MKWKDKISEWKSGIPLTYPRGVKSPFFYETSALNRSGTSLYLEKFIPEPTLPRKQDPSQFQKHLKNTKNKYVCAFPNLSGDAILIIPVPKAGKNFATLKDFIDTASLTQQKMFWKKVASVIETQFRASDVTKLFISTHGLGVPYFHLRLDTRPKYYTTGASKALKPSKARKQRGGVGSWMNWFRKPVNASARKVSPTIAIAIFNSVVKGYIYFAEGHLEGHVRVVVITVDLKGLTPGLHGLNIYEYGYNSRNFYTEECGSASQHYNPTGLNHGGLEKEDSHAGDLGNIVADEYGNCQKRIVTDKFQIAEILGRSIILHENFDDLGGYKTVASKTTGNSGARIACAIIGLAKP
jgi:Cu-Zn family superoxide dismutase